VRNARAYLALRAEGHRLADVVWASVGHRPRQNAWRSPAEIPARTAEADALSRELRRRGFTFVGPTICYAFMQAAGLVNDHTVDCFRHAEIARLAAHDRQPRAGRPPRADRRNP
jgi:DNA-3-methyladenine glycosylase I